MKRACSLAALALLAACAGPDAVLRGEAQISSGHYEEGLKTIQQAADAPGASTETRAALLRNRALVIERLDREARAALAEGRLDEASALFTRMRQMDAERAEEGQAQVKMAREVGRNIGKAEAAFRAGDFSTAESLVKNVLNQIPRERHAMALAERIAERAPPRGAGVPELGPDFKKPITLEFRDAGLKAVFDAIWHASGINFVLDKDIRSDLKVSIMVKDVTVEEAVEAILVTQQLGKRVLGPKMLFIYPKTPQKVGEYQDLVIRNFFLAHVGAKEIQNLLKTILKIKEVYADEKRNLIVVRDTPDRVALAEKLVQAQDQSEPEVMLAVDVIEINRSKLENMGITWPQQIELGVANPISLQQLRALNGAGIQVGVGGLASSAAAATGGTGGTGGTATGTGVLAQLNLAANLGDTKTLANPRIRVRNHEKAKIHIGDRLPVVTSIINSGAYSPLVGQNVNYLDVGIKLEVEPEVMLDDDVMIKLNLEVSNATQDKANPGFYDVGTRNTSTVLTIRDGETQVLAGLIRDDESETNTGIPGLGDLPMLGRLFSSNQSNKTKSEILLAITPHVLRNLQRPAPDLMEYLGGTEAGQSGGAPAPPFRPMMPPQAALPPLPTPAPNPPAAGTSVLSNINSTFSSSNSSTFAPPAASSIAPAPAAAPSTGYAPASPTPTPAPAPAPSPSANGAGGGSNTGSGSGSGGGGSAGGATLPDFEGPPGVGSPAR